MVMRTSDFQPAGPRPKRVTIPAEDSWWKPVVEVAMGGVIVVIAVGARLALAYGWLNGPGAAGSPHRRRERCFAKRWFVY
jgi:hypothetical protein